MKRTLALVGFLIVAAVAMLWPSGDSTRAQANCFTQTGFCISNPAFASYFVARGGTETFGYPISREFTFLGFRVQFFQGHIMQLQPNGSVATMNLLDQGLMPVTRVNGSTFPAADPGLVAQTPSVNDPAYATRIVEFIRANAPEQYAGQPVRYFSTFMETVDLAVAFPGGGGNPNLLPLLNLEIWGSVTSPPQADPSNPGFIYQRFQRSIMHYREVCRCTERILLADWFKTVILGTAPADLAEDMAGTPFINQWNPGGERSLNRPGELPSTDLTNAFVPELPGFATPPAAPATGGGTQPTATPGQVAGAPSVRIILSEDRPRQGEEFRVTIEAEDPDGIQSVWWWATDTDDDDLRDTETRNCRGATPCRESWTVSTQDLGDILLRAQARDMQGNLSAEVTREIRVRELEGTPGPTPSPTGTAQPTATSGPTATAEPTATPTATPTSTP